MTKKEANGSKGTKKPQNGKVLLLGNQESRAKV